VEIPRRRMVSGKDKMKETPLMFSTENVIRIAKGLKTQTRRVVHPQFGLSPNAGKPYIDGNGYLCVIRNRIEFDGWFYLLNEKGKKIKCPYGGAGDQIWVKETYYNFQCAGEAVVYKANLAWEKEERPKPADGWKSAMFMPKRLARIWLTLSESCRIERVQEITEEDVIREGISPYTLARGVLADEPPDPRWNFIELWDSINKKRGYGWDTNPYVWVITHNAFGVRLK